MPRRRTELIAGQFYHIYNRGANRAAIFFDRDHYSFFLRRFREKVSQQHAILLAYCLLPNHYHLLVRVESDGFSSAMQAFGTSFSKAMNKNTGHTGTLFQGRFQAIHVDDEAYLVHLSRYVHRNPVEAGLCADLAAWEFSSYADYIGTRNGQLTCPDIILREFPSRSAYRDFVEATPKHGPMIEHLLMDE